MRRYHNIIGPFTILFKPEIYLYQKMIIYLNVAMYQQVIEKNAMGGACGAYGAGERGVQSSGGET